MDGQSGLLIFILKRCDAYSIAISTCGALCPDPKPEPDRPEDPKELAAALDIALLAFK